MLTYIAMLPTTLIVDVVIFLAGVFLSTKIKDWLKGIPADVRKALQEVEAATVERIATATSNVTSQLPKPTVAAPAAPAVVAPPAPPPSATP